MDWSELSIRDIEKIVKNAGSHEKEEMIKSLQGDNRSGVKSILNKLRKQIECRQREMDRIVSLKKYENMYLKKGAKYIAGIDEVGRGPLAGPVYASAVIFPASCLIEGINDSKKLTPQKRKSLYHIIKENALSCATGCCDEKVIDSINILNATYEAMRQAISKLSIRPHVLLVDGVRVPGTDIFQVPIIKGDSLSFSISAASIIAKVERDEYMESLDDDYPVYNFKSNKGYGTKEHMDAIKKFGPCPLHRKTFIKGII